MQEKLRSVRRLTAVSYAESSITDDNDSGKCKNDESEKLENSIKSERADEIDFFSKNGKDFLICTCFLLKTFFYCIIIIYIFYYAKVEISTYCFQSKVKYSMFVSEAMDK